MILLPILTNFSFSIQKCERNGHMVNIYFQLQMDTVYIKQEAKICKNILSIIA